MSGDRGAADESREGGKEPGDFLRRFRDFGELLRAYDHVERVARRLGKLTAQNVTAMSAVTVLILYLIGLVRRIGQLHAEGISPIRGLPLLPLQRYFVDGTSVMLNPGTLGLLFMVGLATTLALNLPTAVKMMEALQADEAGEPATRSPIRAALQRVVDRVLMAIGVVVVLLYPFAVLLLVPVAEWLPVLAGATPLFVLTFAVAASGVTWSDWSDRHGRLIALALALTFVLAVGLSAYFHPPSYDRVVILTTDHRRVAGPLIAQADGFMYVAGKPVDQRRGEERTIIAVPAARVASARVSKGSDRYWKTVPELACIRFWRVRAADKLRLVRDRKPSCHLL